MAKMKKQKGPKRKMTRMEKREAIAGYLYLLPNFIGFVIFTGIPIFLGLLISFTNYNGFKWKFVGIKNYVKMFGNSQFQQAFINNLFYSLTSVPLTILLSLLLALALNRGMKGSSFFKTVAFFPNLISKGRRRMCGTDAVPAGQRTDQPGAASAWSGRGQPAEMVYVIKNRTAYGCDRCCMEAGGLLYDHVYRRLESDTGPSL